MRSLPMSSARHPDEVGIASPVPDALPDPRAIAASQGSNFNAASLPLQTSETAMLSIDFESGDLRGLRAFRLGIFQAKGGQAAGPGSERLSWSRWPGRTHGCPGAAY